MRESQSSEPTHASTEQLSHELVLEAILIVQPTTAIDKIYSGLLQTYISCSGAATIDCMK